jgi:hypothetical protein
MKVLTVEEFFAHMPPRGRGASKINEETFLLKFLNECTIEDAIIIPKGATRREVFNMLNKLAGEISSNQPTFLNHTYEERAAYWNEKYTKGE